MFTLREPEYILCRKAYSENTSLLSRVRFPEAKSILDIVIRQFADSAQDSTVIDVGCGSGAACMHLAYYAGIRNIIGIDLDKTTIHEAQSTKELLHMEGLQFIVASASNLPLRNATFNFILCQELIEHVRDPEAVLRETKRILKNGGSLLLTTPTTAFAPLSSDWFEIKLRHSLIMDEFSGHLNRFEARALLKSICGAGLQIKHTQLTHQYLTPLMVAALDLWKRRSLRKRKDKGHSKRSHHPSLFKGLPNAIFMAAQTIEYSVFENAPFGSNIVVFAGNHTSRRNLR